MVVDRVDWLLSIVGASDSADSIGCGCGIPGLLPLADARDGRSEGAAGKFRSGTKVWTRFEG